MLSSSAGGTVFATTVRTCDPSAYWYTVLFVVHTHMQYTTGNVISVSMGPGWHSSSLTISTIAASLSTPLHVCRPWHDVLCCLSLVACVPVSVYPGPHKGKMMQLSTGRVRVHSKTDCWVSFDQYMEFARCWCPTYHSILPLCILSIITLGASMISVILLTDWAMWQEVGMD